MSVAARVARPDSTPPAALAMGGLTYGAIEGGAAGFTSPRVVTALVVAAALAGFLLVQARSRHPMMPLDLFRSRNVSVAVGVGFAFIVGYYGLPFVVSLDLQQQRGLSPLGTGVAFLPMMLIGLVLTPFSARIAERTGARLLVTGGLVVMTAGLAALAAISASAPVWLLAGGFTHECTSACSSRLSSHCPPRSPPPRSEHHAGPPSCASAPPHSPRKDTSD